MDPQPPVTHLFLIHLVHPSLLLIQSELALQKAAHPVGFWQVVFVHFVQPSTLPAQSISAAQVVPQVRTHLKELVQKLHAAIHCVGTVQGAPQADKQVLVVLSQVVQ